MKRKNKPQLAIENARTLAGKVEWEGELSYVLENWQFADFKDKKFNSLRKAYIKALTDMTDYCALYRVEDEEQDAIDAEEQAEADKVNEECPHCGDTLEDNGTCPTCTDGSR